MSDNLDIRGKVHVAHSDAKAAHVRRVVHGQNHALNGRNRFKNKI